MNTQDRELLDLAAKAAGYKFKWFKVKQFKITDPPYGRCRYFTGYKDVFGKHHTKPWNPLEDDGAALRLRNAMQMTIIDEGDKVFVEAARYPQGSIVREPYVRDLPGGFASQSSVDAAVRRAIVRAAAEIGRSMK